MTPQQPFQLIYAPIVKEHLRAIERQYHSLIRDEIAVQLQFEPDVQTRNRKPLKRSVLFGAEWEIRLGPDNCFRVFYRIDRAQRQVYIMAVGEKREDRLSIGGEEIEI